MSAPTPEWRGTAVPLVPGVSAHPRVERDSCSLGAWCQRPPQSGEGQLFPWCLVSAPTPEWRGTAVPLVPGVSTHPRVERDSCSLGAWCQRPPQSGEGQLFPWCLVSAPTPEWRGTAVPLVPGVSTHPRVERDSCSLGAWCQHPPQSGEGQLFPWCLVSGPTPEWRGTAVPLVPGVSTHPRVERDSCSLGAWYQDPPQSGEGQLFSQGQNQHRNISIETLEDGNEGELDRRVEIHSLTQARARTCARTHTLTNEHIYKR